MSEFMQMMRAHVDREIAFEILRVVERQKSTLRKNATETKIGTPYFSWRQQRWLRLPEQKGGRV